jgi:cation transporter-like permease
MTTAQEVVQAFNALPQTEKEQAAAEIQEVAPLPRAPDNVIGTLWLMVVGALVFGFAGGLVGIFILIEGDKSTDVLVPIVTTVLGFLGGLLAPSPAPK